MVEIEVVNVVGTITYQQEIALAPLSETLLNRNEIASVTYEPSENHWLQTRLISDDIYIAFYRNGRCTITGCGSTEQLHEVVSQVNFIMADILELEYEPVAEVDNIVAMADFGAGIPLETLAIEFGLNNVEYEPEQFPALIYRGANYVILIFSSGKLLCTGLDDRDDVSDTIEEMVSRLKTAV